MGESFDFDVLKTDPDFVDIEMPLFEPYANDHEGDHPPVPDIDDADPDTYDTYIGAEVELLIGDRVMSGKVRRQKCKQDGALKGTAHLNLILDTRTYEVEFPDGQTTEYSANIIVENMYAQCDTEGNQYLLLKEIVDWKKDNSATDLADMYVTCGSN